MSRPMTNTRAVATRSARPAATDWTRPAKTASTTVEHNDRPRHEHKITGGWVFPPDLSHELRHTSPPVVRLQPRIVCRDGNDGRVAPDFAHSGCSWVGL